MEEAQESSLTSDPPFPKASFPSGWCQGNEFTVRALSEASVLQDVSHTCVGLGVKQLCAWGDLWRRGPGTGVLSPPELLSVVGKVVRDAGPDYLLRSGVSLLGLLAFRRLHFQKPLASCEAVHFSGSLPLVTAPLSASLQLRAMRALQKPAS